MVKLTSRYAASLLDYGEERDELESFYRQALLLGYNSKGVLLSEASESLDKKLYDTASLSGAACYAKEFIDKIQKIMDSAGIKTPLEALFVTPADLYENAKNLKEYGSGWLWRDDSY